MLAGKRGVIFFSVILALLFVLIFLPWAANNSYVKESKFKKMMGDSEILLLYTYDKGERAMYYIDRSAELALRDSVYQFSKEGALAKSDCGKSAGGYVKWNQGAKTCYPAEPGIGLSDLIYKNLGEYLMDFPIEAIPRIDFNLTFRQRKENIMQVIAKANASLRIDISEKNDFMGFKVDIAPVDTMEEPKNKVPTDTGGSKVNPIPTPVTGKCQALAEYAKQYIGCAYASEDISGAFIPPNQCDRLTVPGISGATYTCAGLTSSVVLNVYNIYYTGHGREKCDQGQVHKISKDPNLLKPGDFFSSEVRCNGGKNCNAGYTPWGHTGIYIGRGHVSNNGYGRVTCYLTYQYDPNGEPVFIHSNGGGEHSVPGVCYATFNQLFNQNSYFVLKDFCRLNVCGA